MTESLQSPGPDFRAFHIEKSAVFQLSPKRGAMIYQLHEFQKTVMAPAVAWADTARHLFTNPLSPLAYTPLSRTIAANSEMFVRLMRRYPKPAWGIDEALVNGERVAITREV